MTEYFPRPDIVDSLIPERPKRYLQEAIDTIHSPTASIIVCAGAVDAMLKEKGLKDGTLYARIQQARENHLITPEMATWAHQVRMDANDERHVDDAALIPTSDDALKAIAFTKALAELLFVLPTKVSAGLQASSQPK